MEYTVTLDNNEVVSVYADNLDDAYLYALTMYRGNALGCSIVCGKDFAMHPALEYYDGGDVFSADYIAELVLTINIMARENRLRTHNELAGISKEQAKTLYERYELFRMWHKEGVEEW